MQGDFSLSHFLLVDICCSLFFVTVVHYSFTTVSRFLMSFFLMMITLLYSRPYCKFLLLDSQKKEGGKTKSRLVDASV